MTVVVNFIGSPGSGKSSLAAATFAELKFRGHNVELVTEYAKELAWQGELAVANDKEILKQQLKRLMGPMGKTDIILTDAPLVHNIYYSGGLTESIALPFFQNLDHINYFVHKPGDRDYNPMGRIQNKSQSDKIKADLLDMLKKLGEGYQEVVSTKSSVPFLADDILLKVRQMHNNLRREFGLEEESELECGGD